MLHLVWLHFKTPDQAKKMRVFALAGLLTRDSKPHPCEISPVDHASINLDPQGAEPDWEAIGRIPMLESTGWFDSNQPLPDPHKAFDKVVEELTSPVRRQNSRLKPP